MREFAKFFNTEVREKKTLTNGNKYRTSRNGSKRSSSKVRFASDLLSRKDKKEYTKSGKVESYNMYETIIPKHEFELKDVETQRAMLTRWREIYSNDKIMKEMGYTANATYYRLIKELDVPQKAKGGYKRRRTVVANTDSIPSHTPQTATTQQLTTKGLHLEYNGKYDAEQLSKIFTKLQLLIEGEDNEFNLLISITENK